MAGPGDASKPACLAPRAESHDYTLDYIDRESHQSERAGECD
jgi:hypothetical protein